MMLKMILRLVMVMSMLSVFVSARNLDYTSGWQMKGFGGYSADIDPETFLFGNPHVKYMWAYQNGSWHVGYIHEAGTGTSSIPAITSIANNDGFWIKTDGAGTLSIPITDSTEISQSNMSIKSGWNMYGYNKPISNVTFNNPHVKIVWSYNPSTSKWSAYSSDSTMQSLITARGIATITTINENEGFWVNADSAVELNITTPSNSAPTANTGTDQTLFQEDFSGDLSKWNIAGSPTPSIVSTEGNPAPAFSTNDDLNYGGWAISKSTFDYSNGLTLSVDTKPGHASFPDQRFSIFVLNQGNALYMDGSSIRRDKPIIKVILTADDYGTTSGWGEKTPGPWISFYIYDESGNVLEEKKEIPISSGSGWHNIKAKIQSDLTVQFYLDNTLLYTTQKSIPASFSGLAAIGLGDRLSYYDNVKVTGNNQTTKPSNTFTEDFSNDLSKWIDEGNNEWSIKNGILNVQYDVSCGSTGCPHADLILKDQYQMSGNYDASVDMIRTQSPGHPIYFQAMANFSLWKDKSHKISVNVGGGGDSWDGKQTQINVNVQTWDGTWSASLNKNIPYNWDPNTWNTVTLKKAGAIYSIYINGTYLTKYTDNFLNGTGKIGLHSYGTKRYDNFVLKSDVATNTTRSYKNFKITANKYAMTAGTSDAGCKSEFGNSYALADWTDIKALYSNEGSLTNFFNGLKIVAPGAEGDSSYNVSYNGQEFYSSDRHYFISRHDHNKPSNYLAHDNINNYELSLGSWSGDRPALCITSNVVPEKNLVEINTTTPLTADQVDYTEFSGNINNNVIAMATDKSSGENLAAVGDMSGGVVTSLKSVLFTNSKKQSVTILFNTEGLPTKVTAEDGSYITFNDWTASSVVQNYYDKDNTLVASGIKVNYNADDISKLKNLYASLMENGSVSPVSRAIVKNHILTKSQIFKWAGFVANDLGCGVAIGVAVGASTASFGLATLPAAAVATAACASAIASTASTMTPNTVVGTTANTFDAALCGSLDPFSCVAAGTDTLAIVTSSAASTHIYFPSENAKFNVNDYVEFHASVNIDYLQVASVVWSFGDGDTYSNMNDAALHKYTKPGTYIVSIEVTYQDGTKVSDQVIIEITTTAPTLSSISISGSSSVDEGASTSYSLQANYSDGSSKNVNPTWSENSNYATISSSGSLTTSSVNADTTVTITASYSGKTTTKNVTIKNVETPVVIQPLKVTSPSSGTNVARGNSYTITWDASDSSIENVKIQLYKPGETTMQTELITSSTPNDGSYTWNLSKDGVIGSYTIRVSDTANWGTVYDFSDTFTISDSTGNTSTSVLKKTGQITSYAKYDDGYYQKGVTPNYTRDINTVTDNVTHLMWQDDATPATMTWNNAKTYCSNLSLDGYTDWRLPTRKELAGLSEFGKDTPDIDLTFQNTISSTYWSSNTDASYIGYAWLVSFYEGEQESNDKFYNNYVRCVRVGQ